jgi:hypothetical protein
MSLFRVNAPEKLHHFDRFAKPFHLAIRASPGDLDAIVNDAVGNAGPTVHTQILDYRDFSVLPVEGVGGAGFDAEFAFYALAGPFVDGDGALVEEFLNVQRVEESLAFSLLFFLCGFKKKLKNVAFLSVVLLLRRHPRFSSFLRLSTSRFQAHNNMMNDAY